MRVFFGFGNTKLRITVIGEIFAERVMKFLFSERDFYVSERFVVLRKTDVVKSDRKSVV